MKKKADTITASSVKVSAPKMNPHTYPKGGLGFGIGAGGISAGIPSNPVTRNRMNLGGSLKDSMRPNTTTVATSLKKGLAVKTANEKGNSMLEKIAQLANEQCGGDPEKMKAFLEGFYETVFEKQASAPREAAGFAGKLIEGLGSNFGKGIAGITLGLGAMGLAAGVHAATSASTRQAFEQALIRAVQMSPALRSAKKDKVNSFAETIYKFAPHVATDANVLASVLTNTIQGDLLDPVTIKYLTDLESRYNEIRSPVQSMFSPKTYI